jgi:hypothetical protein
VWAGVVRGRQGVQECEGYRAQRSREPRCRKASLFSRLEPKSILEGHREVLVMCHRAVG